MGYYGYVINIENMRTIIGLFLAAFMFIGCSEESTTDNIIPSENGRIQFILGGSAADKRVKTRTDISASPVYTLSSNDNIGVYCSKTTSLSDGTTASAARNYQMVLNEDGTFTPFDFYWQASTVNILYLYSPWNSGSLNNNVPLVQGALPLSQSQTAPSISANKSNLLYRVYTDFATYQKGKFYVEGLKPLLPTLQMTVVCADLATATEIKSMTVTSSADLKYGTYKYQMATGKITTWSDATTTKTFTLNVSNCPLTDSNSAADLFMVMPPVENTTLTIKVVLANGTTLTKTVDNVTLELGGNYRYTFIAGESSMGVNGVGRELNLGSIIVAKSNLVYYDGVYRFAETLDECYPKDKEGNTNLTVAWEDSNRPICRWKWGCLLPETEISQTVTLANAGHWSGTSNDPCTKVYGGKWRIPTYSEFLTHIGSIAGTNRNSAYCYVQGMDGQKYYGLMIGNEVTNADNGKNMSAQLKNSAFFPAYGYLWTGYANYYYVKAAYINGNGFGNSNYYNTIIGNIRCIRDADPDGQYGNGGEG